MSRHDDTVALRQMLDHIGIPATDFPQLAAQIKGLLGDQDEAAAQGEGSPP